MFANQIYEHESYTSIHGVPYRVLEITEHTVRAKCELGQAPTLFEMPIDRFAQAMQAPIQR